MNTPIQAKELERIVRILATIAAFPDRRTNVLQRLRLDEATVARDERAFGEAFAQLSLKERAALTALHREHSATLARDGTRVEDLGPEPEPETRRDTRRPARGPMPNVETQVVESVRPHVPTLPFAGQTTPERLAVIRAAHPLDEQTAGEGDDTAVAPRPEFSSATPWDDATGEKDAAVDAETTVRAKPPADWLVKK